MIKFPKLEKFTIDLRCIPSNFMQRICLESCSQSLRELTLVPSMLGTTAQYGFIKSMKCLTELKMFSVLGYQYSLICRVIEHFKKLR